MIVIYSDNHKLGILRERAMKIAVVGATGRTGRQVVEQALTRGDDVIALARHPGALAQRGPGVAVAAADVLDRAAVTGALAGADAVVSALGIGASRQPTVVYSEGTANILHAMGAHGITKLAVISAVPAGPRAEQPFCGVPRIVAQHPVSQSLFCVQMALQVKCGGFPPPAQTPKQQSLLSPVVAHSCPVSMHRRGY